MAESTYSFDVTAQDFGEIVLQNSRTVPVVVDFWADWCAPCRTLMPILAKLAEEYRGKFILAKVDTEQQRELAAQFNIRSLPTVLLFRDGTAVDEFQGALPESAIRSFIDGHIPHPAEAWLRQAEDLLAQGRLDAAQRLIQEALAEDPDNPEAQLATARLQFAAGDWETARSTLSSLPATTQDAPPAAALRAQVGFAEAVAAAPAEQELTQALARDPDASESRYQLAARKALAGDFESALDHLLVLLQKDPGFGEGSPRKAMLGIFGILGSGSDLAARFRNRMFALLH